MLKKISKYVAIFLGIGVLLNGCKSETSPQVASQDASHTSAQTHEKHSPGKPGAPVTLTNQQPFYIEKTGVYDYEISLSTPISSGTMTNRTMTVTVSSNSAIEIVSSPTMFEFDLNSAAEHSIPLKINVSELGRHYIQLHVSINEGGQISSRSITAIVQAGVPPVKAQKATAASSNTTSDVISLPAQETISSQ